jgi:hypothetical protein
MVDVFILAIYLLTLLIVFTQMIEEINQSLIIVVDRSTLDQQIHQQNLGEILELKFNWAESYRNQALTVIPLEVKNKSLTHVIYVNWQYSTFTDERGRSQRLIYQVPGLTVDLFQPQVFTVVATEQILEAKLFTETCLKRDPENQALVVKHPIFNWQKMKEILKKNQSFSLQLVIQVTEPIYQSPQINLNTLKCQFTLKKIPWQQVLYWKSKKKQLN